MKKHILFVDDEPNVLNGLRRSLRPLREKWECEFANDAKKALEYLSQKKFDAIVCDVRMPGMDGAQLLQIVSKKHPNVIRIILTGHADEELLLKSVMPTHQYLSKPIDVEHLISILERTFALRTLLSNDRIKQLVSRIDTLPSLPKLYMELMKEIQSPEASIQKVGEIISQDVGMTAKILKLANSAYFGLRRQLQNPAEAVMFLGLNFIRALVLSTEFFSKYDASKFPHFSLEALFEHSVTVGFFAKTISESQGEKKRLTGDSLMAGMLHDIGKIILADNLHNEYNNVMTLVKKETMPLWKAEKEIFGASHAEVGAYLLGLWGLPDTIVEAIAYHHTPGDCQHLEFNTLTAIHVANALVNRIKGSKNPGQSEEIDLQYLQKLNVDKNLQEWEKLCLEKDQRG